MSGPERIKIYRGGEGWWRVSAFGIGDVVYTEYIRADLHEAVVRERDEARAEAARAGDEIDEHEAAYNEKFADMERELDTLRRALDEAPHAGHCASMWCAICGELDDMEYAYDDECKDETPEWYHKFSGLPCDCYKSRLPRAGGES